MTAYTFYVDYTAGFRNSNTWLRRVSKGHGTVIGEYPCPGVIESQAVAGAPEELPITSIDTHEYVITTKMP